MSDQPMRKPWWRLFRFRLQSLVIGIGILCGALGWIVHRAKVQRDAVTAVERAGGKVMYDWEWRWNNRGRPVPTGATRWRGWLTDHFGIDYFSNVTYVELRYRGSDDLLEQIGQLHKLEYLVFAGSPVSDAGLAHLDGLTSLRWLSLEDTQITDAGLVHLKRLTRLQTLILRLTRVSDSGLTRLKSLTGLKNLSIHLTEISDLGWRDLQRALPMTLIAGPGWAGREQGRAIDLNEKAATAKPDHPDD